MTTQVWHYEHAGQTYGPITLAEIQQLISNGTLTGFSRVWTSTQSNWIPLNQTELVTYLKPPAMTPPHMTPPPLTAPMATVPMSATTPGSAAVSTSNIVVWILAFAPMIGFIMQGMVAGAMSANEYTVDYEVAEAMQNGRYWYITLLLNLGLCFWDSKNLKRSGVALGFDTKWVFLVPVYLWKRAQSFQQTPSYFWTWLACFVFSILSAQNV